MTLEPSGVALITFDRPGVLNALDMPAMLSFSEAVDELYHELDVAGTRQRSGEPPRREGSSHPARASGSTDGPERPRAVVITGTGREAFCAGGDQRALHSFSGADAGRRVAAVMGDALARLERLPVPVLAAVEGHALGGGSEIALACDIVVAAEDARMGMVHRRMGLAPGWGGGQRLLRRAGHPMAMRIMLDAKPISGRELLDLHLADVLAPPGHALRLATSMAEDIAAMPREVVAAIKQTVLDARDLPYERAMERERERFPALWAGPAHEEAVEAFLARRQRAGWSDERQRAAE